MENYEGNVEGGSSSASVGVEGLEQPLLKYHRYTAEEKETLWEIVETGKGGRYRQVIKDKKKTLNHIKNK